MTLRTVRTTWFPTVSCSGTSWHPLTKVNCSGNIHLEVTRFCKDNFGIPSTVRACLKIIPKWVLGKRGEKVDLFTGVALLRWSAAAKLNWVGAVLAQVVAMGRRHKDSFPWRSGQEGQGTKVSTPEKKACLLICNRLFSTWTLEFWESTSKDSVMVHLSWRCEGYSSLQGALLRL